MTDDTHELSRIIITRFGDVVEEVKGWKPESPNEYALFVGTLMKLWQHGLSALKIAEEPYIEKFPDHRDYFDYSRNCSCRPRECWRFQVSFRRKRDLSF